MPTKDDFDRQAESCRQGDHSLIEITRREVETDVEMVTRWCVFCGAITVDRDYDNRTSAGYYRRMQGPASFFQEPEDAETATTPRLRFKRRSPRERSA